MTSSPPSPVTPTRLTSTTPPPSLDSITPAQRLPLSSPPSQTPHSSPAPTSLTAPTWANHARPVPPLIVPVTPDPALLARNHRAHRRHLTEITQTTTKPILTATEETAADTLCDDEMQIDV
ncbi:hypothetical protein MMC12_004358 [Toensbergia leucococca]|nr:hypothetical protein [Toensbergia leucococca]